MKLRLTEEYDVKYDCTRFVVERKERFNLLWDRVMSYSDRSEAQAVYDRFKNSKGEYWHTKILDEVTVE